MRTNTTKKIYSSFIFATLSLLAIFGLSDFLVAQNHSGILKNIHFDDIEFHPPKINRETIHNSHVFLLEDNQLPYLDLHIIFPNTGIINESIDQAGILDTTLQLMEKGGAGGQTGEQTAMLLSSLGARVNISQSQDHWQLHLKVLTSRFEQAFEVVEGMLLNPTLEKDTHITIIKSMDAQIDRRNEKPDAIAHRKLSEIMYHGHRLGYSLQKKDLKKLDYQSIKENAQSVISSQAPIIGISGDFHKTNIRAKLASLLKKLPQKKQLGQIANTTFNTGSNKQFQDKIYLIQKDVPQAVLLMSKFLPPKKNPDFYALQTGNYILGGGSFNSRLMKEIRVNRGLAYYAYSHNIFFDDYGRFLAGTGTRNQKVSEAFGLMKEIISGMHKQMESGDVHLASQSILNSLVFSFDSPDKYLTSHIRFYMEGMPENYLENFPANIRQQNTNSIKAAYKKHISSNGFFQVVVGPASLKKDLIKFAPVIVLSPEDHVSIHNSKDNSEQ